MIRLSMTQLYPRYQGFHCSWRRGLCTSKKIYYAWNIIHLLHILMGIFFMVNKLSQKASGTVIKSGLLDQTRVPRFRVGNPLAIISKFWCPRSCMRRIYLSLFTNVVVTLRYAVILYYYFFSWFKQDSQELYGVCVFPWVIHRPPWWPEWVSKVRDRSTDSSLVRWPYSNFVSTMTTQFGNE